MFSFRKLTLNLVLFINVLLIFLLIFEENVQLPVFLQVTGRMHPLILHFPLALLFLGIFLEWLASRKRFQDPSTREIISYVFYLFALGAAFTALFGFFLYKEGGYQGEEMILHKWLGASVSIFAGVIVWLKDKPSVIYYGTLGATAICVILAGHLGAEITHGKGFLTEPFRRQTQAQVIQIEHVDSAIVFRDVIQPILNEKCINCHNTNKAKNNLVVTDYQSLIKGGDSKDVVVAGKANESLLYQYALLPMDDSLHMPPRGKLQLEQDEIRLIGWWINTGAFADAKYLNYEKVDSIHSVMVTRFQPKTGLDLVDIPFADQKKIKNLNNPYRTVQQISASKPYIAVFLGSKKDFSSKDLNELKDLRQQITSLDLGNSEVENDDLKIIGQFPHLQKLHLQNIPVGDEGVKQLSKLSYLETLNISGTKISSSTLDEVSSWKNLKKLYLYNTAVPDESIKTLKTAHPKLEVFKTQFDLTDTVYNAQLTTPITKIDSTFFQKNATVEIKLSRGKVNYFYTLDGTDPSSKATLYTEPLQVSQSGVLKIIAKMDGWMDSEIASFPLMKLGIKPDRINLETKPDPKYIGKLDTTLVNGISGSLNREDKEYLGFVNRDLQVLFQLNEPKTLSQLTLSFLEDMENGILAPENVEVWGGEDKNNLKCLGMGKTERNEGSRPATKNLIMVSFPEQPVAFLRLKVKNPRVLPDWHPLNSKTKASIFIDEVSFE